MNARYFCTIDKCGRAFQREEDLNVHLERRHEIIRKAKKEDKEEGGEEGEEDVNEAQIKAKERLFGKRVERAQKKAEKLTTMLVQEATGEDNLEEINEVKPYLAHFEGQRTE